MIKKWNYEVSEKCNLKCTYCDVDVDSELVSTMQMFDTFKKDYLDTSEPYKFDIYGGEPFLQLKLVKYIVNILSEDNNCLSIFIPTNGTLFNDDIIKIAKTNKVKIVVSHDGINQKVNRGTNKIFIKEFISIGVIKAHSMITGKDFTSTSNFLTNNHNVISELGLNPEITLVRDIGSFNNKEVNYFLQDYSKYINFIAKKINSNKYNTFDQLPGLISKYLYSLLNYIVYGQKKQNCGLGDSYQVYKPSGDILPCARFGRHDKISVIFKNKEYLEMMSVCNTCSIRDICDKGCLYEHIRNKAVLTEICDIYKGIYKEIKRLIKLTDHKLLKLFNDNSRN